MTTYLYATNKGYLIPLMIIQFIKALPNWNFKLWPRFRYRNGYYQIYSRNFT